MPESPTATVWPEPSRSVTKKESTVSIPMWVRALSFLVSSTGSGATQATEGCCRTLPISEISTTPHTRPSSGLHESVNQSSATASNESSRPRPGSAWRCNSSSFQPSNSTIIGPSSTSRRSGWASRPDETEWTATTIDSSASNEICFSSPCTRNPDGGIVERISTSAASSTAIRASQMPTSPSTITIAKSLRGSARARGK